ncbi:MAG TPA: T9SS type A sorting domain-containing protein [Chitinophagales bacterium]|nr:T9SS type A sorting domain-containing protein [Chitinophagales bacterium]HMU68380.1 T9SS type A sorting domain-containing protein [Chitinophagales bacterium]HMX03074.1 T9SS type A sorting domain-containing protein [Chitinophagales bacterium]HNK97797.1 T9SS type A sorting domain-containing protein [Chitinophagales bacterium]
MNKKIAIIIIIGSILLTFVSMAIVFILQKDDNNFHHTETNPAPVRVDGNHEKEDESYNRDRQNFFDQMHKSAPGTNWRKMDADLRFQLMKQRSNNLRTDDIAMDTLASGALIGEWNEMGSYNTSGRIRATEVDFENETIYAFSDGGNLWKGDLDGENWAVINDNMKITGAHTLRKIGDRLIVGCDQWGVQGVFYTEDEGLTWNATTGLENVAAWGYISDMEILNDANHTIYLLAYEWDYTNWWDIVSLYRSEDLGVSFTKLSSYDVPVYGGANHFVLWSPPYGSPDCYMIENTHVNLLDATGTPVLQGTLPITDDGDYMLCGFEGPSSTSLYVAHRNYVDNFTHFYTSFDGGVNWNTEGIIEEGNFSKNSFNCSQKQEGYLFYGGVDSYRSFTAGNSWVRNNYWYEYYGDIEYNLHADIPFIRTFIDGGGDEIVLISTDGGLYKSTDNGLIWNNITNEGMRNAQYYDVYTYRWVTDILFAGAQDQGYQRSSYTIGDDYYFDQLISGDYGHIVSRSGGDNLWCVYPGFAMYVNDAASASNLTTWDFQGYGHLWMAPIMQDPWNDQVAWWGGGSDAGGAYLWRLQKSGAFISGVKQAKNFSVAGGGSISAISYSPIDPNYWYLLTSGGNFYHSEDAGETWYLSSGFSGPGPQYFYGATIEPSKSQLGVVYIGGSGYDNPAVYMSDDHGDNFVELQDGLPPTLVYDLAVDQTDSLLFAATEVAPYVCVLAEGKWYNIAANDAPLQTYWSVDYVDEINTVRFGTYGRGAWEFAIEKLPTINIHDANQEALMSVYPNPASEKIQITIPAYFSNAEVTVVNMQGDIVYKTKATINKDMPYNIPVSGLAAGSYVIAVKQGEKMYTSKFVRI